MSNEAAAKIKDEIELLQLHQQELFKAGWQEGKGKSALVLTIMLLVLFGIGGVIDVLSRGLTWLSAILITIGGLALYKGLESEKATKACREQYQKNRSTLADLEEKYRELTFIPKTPEEIEREWKEAMRELEAEARTPS